MASLPTHFPLRVAGGKTIQIPSVGYGTWAAGGPNLPAAGDWVKQAVLTALQSGYRHLDCAWYYGVDREIGAAIRESGIPRSEIFVTSKVWNNFFAPDAIEICLDKVLTDMGLEYLDLFLVHWPVAFQAVSMEALKNARAEGHLSHADRGIRCDEKGNELIDWKHTSAPIAKAAGQPEGSMVPTWNAMKELVRKGKVRAVGVSNFGIKDLQDLLDHSDDPTNAKGTDIPISCNQVEVHPWLPNIELIEFSNKHGIVTSCFSPFAGQKKDGSTLIKDDTVKKLAEKNAMDVGQLLQSWAVQRGTIPLGKSQNEGMFTIYFLCH